jgi:hypothetical protein
VCSTQFLKVSVMKPHHHHTYKCFRALTSKLAIHPHATCKGLWLRARMFGTLKDNIPRANAANLGLGCHQMAGPKGNSTFHGLCHLGKLTPKICRGHLWVSGTNQGAGDKVVSSAWWADILRASVLIWEDWECSANENAGKNQQR